MPNNHQVAWDVVKSVKSGKCIVEVSASNTTPKRFSYRVSWSDSETKKGAWFPDRDISFLNDIAVAVQEAEKWILDEREKELAAHEARVTERRNRENDKRKRHSDNVERRREENRAATAAAKGSRKG